MLQVNGASFISDIVVGKKYVGKCLSKKGEYN